MTKKLIIKILDEVNIVLIGLTRSETEHFYNKFAALAPNYFFHPLYKLGRWDGRISFFNKNGKTSIHFLDEIMPDLQAWGYQIEVKDKRKKININIPEIDKDYFLDYDITLGDHQVEAVNAIFNNGGGILVAGTGAGKTIITAVMCDLIERANLKTLVIVPTIDLISQTINELKMFDLDVGEFSGKKKDVDHSHVVSTWQSLQNTPTILGMFNAVIVDECQGVRGNVLNELLNTYLVNCYIRIGLTGTMPKEPVEILAIRSALGNVVYTVPAYELIDKGWLAKLELRILRLTEDFHDKWEEYKSMDPDPEINTYEKFKDTYFPDYTSEKEYLQRNEVRNNFLIDFITDLRQREKGNTLVLVNNVNFGKKLAANIDNAYFIYGKDDTKVRAEIYKLFSTNDDVVVIATFKLVSTGLNIPRIFNMVLVDSGKSFIQVIQSIGRSLRKAADKDTARVYDVCSDLKYSKKHTRERIRYYKEQKYPFKLDNIDYNQIYV